MKTNLAIDSDLLAEAVRLGGHNTETAAVTEALEEYVQCRQQLEILDLFGAIDYDLDYDYRAQRGQG